MQDKTNVILTIKEKPLNLVYLLLGSNTGDSRSILHSASDLIQKSIGKIISSSSLYETEPWGNKEQAPFLNQILIVETDLSAEKVLQTILGIEKIHGRERIERWAPRTLDIDILYFNKDIIVTKNLKVPHAELHNRKFTLIPLTEIDPDFLHPVFNLTNKELLEKCKDELLVKKI